MKDNSALNKAKSRVAQLSHNISHSTLQVYLPCVVGNMTGPLQWTRDGFGLGTRRTLPGFPRFYMGGGKDQGGG